MAELITGRINPGESELIWQANFIISAAFSFCNLANKDHLISDLHSLNGNKSTQNFYAVV